MAAPPVNVHERLRFLRNRMTCRQRRDAGLLGFAPWINLGLLAFLFYIVQSQRLLSPGLVLSLPVAPFSAGAPADAEVLTVLRTGAIFFRDERVALENLPAVLGAARRPGARDALLVEADGHVPHRALVDVYGAAQQAGYRQVVLATRLQDAVPGGRARP